MHPLYLAGFSSKLRTCFPHKNASDSHEKTESGIFRPLPAASAFSASIPVFSFIPSHKNKERKWKRRGDNEIKTRCLAWLQRGSLIHCSWRREKMLHRDRTETITFTCRNTTTKRWSLMAFTTAFKMKTVCWVWSSTFSLEPQQQWACFYFSNSSAVTQGKSSRIERLYGELKKNKNSNLVSLQWYIGYIFLVYNFRQKKKS